MLAVHHAPRLAAADRPRALDARGGAIEAPDVAHGMIDATAAVVGLERRQPGWSQRWARARRTASGNASTEQPSRSRERAMTTVGVHGSTSALGMSNTSGRT